MIKKTILALLIALPMSLFAQKFGVVEAEPVLTAMPEYTAMQTQINDASKKYEDELNRLKEQMNKQVTEYQALEKDAATPESIKERRIQEMQELDQKIQQFTNTAMQDLQRQQQQLMAPIEQKFMDACKSVGQEGGYTFIFPQGSALFVGSTVEDVTPLIKAKLGVK